MFKTLKRDCMKYSKELSPEGKRVIIGTITAGTSVEVVIEKGFPTIMTIKGPEFSVRCRSSNWNRYFSTNPKPPSDKMIEKWTYDSICKSLNGKTVEPDGWDSDGTPSWLLALGMI